MLQWIQIRISALVYSLKLERIVTTLEWESWVNHAGVQWTGCANCSEVWDCSLEGAQDLNVR